MSSSTPSSRSTARPRTHTATSPRPATSTARPSSTKSWPDSKGRCSRGRAPSSSAGARTTNGRATGPPPTSSRSPTSSTRPRSTSSRRRRSTATGPTRNRCRAPGDVVADVKARTEGDIGVHASITLARSLLAAGLVDELCLAVGRVLDPVGPRLFAGLPERRELTLVEAAPTTSGSVWLRYRLSHSLSVIRNSLTGGAELAATS